MTPPPVEPLPGEPVKASGAAEGTLVLLAKTGLTKVEVLCTALKVTEGLLEVSGAVSGKLHYEGCSTKLNGGGATACKPHSPGAAEGLIETNALIGSIKLHTGGISLVSLSPKTGSVFVTLVMGSEVKSECSIGAKFDVTGTFLAHESNGELEVEAQTHSFGAQASLSGLLFGGNAATLDGSVSVDLSEKGVWSGLG
jgi:hypothetical protein